MKTPEAVVEVAMWIGVALVAGMVGLIVAAIVNHQGGAA